VPQSLHGRFLQIVATSSLTSLPSKDVIFFEGLGTSERKIHKEKTEGNRRV
jgi:hypothetical protein